MRWWKFAILFAGVGLAAPIAYERLHDYQRARITTFLEPFNLQFSQFLVRDAEPLLYHTGPRAMFPAVKEAVASLIDVPDGGDVARDVPGGTEWGSSAAGGTDAGAGPGQRRGLGLRPSHASVTGSAKTAQATTRPVARRARQAWSPPTT